ncbi:MAG TPA: lipid-A-disaccharide synthase [Saprospiraceae bacterium]|nr:lipid-A-disaccharide synthase [Saprospiraceae bacterium]
MRYYLIAGEASGDLHGAHLIRHLRQEDPEADIRAWGGDLMSEAGAEVVKHYRDLAFMGFWEVLKNLRTIMANFRFCKADILAWQPDVLILIDYPGFNLRMAKWAKSMGIRVFYYISPQLWAWHSSRVHGIKATVERMFVILPFEEEFYQKYDYKVDFVGHPLLDVVDEFVPPADFRAANGLDERPIVALLPGSRRQEIARMLEVMLQTAARFPDYQFVIAGAPSIPRSFYDDIIRSSGVSGVHWTGNQTYALLSQARAALVTSGTATLETALFGVPQTVCYRGSSISFFIARRLVNVKYISLVNLIADRPLVRELIQHQLHPDSLGEQLRLLLDDHHARQLREGYQELRLRLGERGAAQKAARGMVRALGWKNELLENP